MAWTLPKGFIGPAQKVASSVATSIPRFGVVKSGTVVNEVLACPTSNIEPVGVVQAQATGNSGQTLTVYGRGNYVKAVAAASLGNGADVGVASANHALGPISGASGVSIFRVGVAKANAAAGDVFTLYVDPKQLSNLI